MSPTMTFIVSEKTSTELYSYRLIKPFTVSYFKTGITLKCITLMVKQTVQTFRMNHEDCYVIYLKVVLFQFLGQCSVSVFSLDSGNS